jgi:hypothetical protein
MAKWLDILNDAETSHFAISAETGSITAGAATKLIWYCWWTSSAKVAIIRKVELEGVIATTAFAVGQLLYQLNIARAFTAENGVPGGTSLTITAPNQKLDTPYAATGMAAVRIASTAALGAPVWTLDANPIATINSHSSAGVNAATPIIGNQYIADGQLFNADIAGGESPIVLHQNEGLAIQVTVPATGVWIAGVNMKWAETGHIIT